MLFCFISDLIKETSQNQCTSTALHKRLLCKQYQENILQETSISQFTIKKKQLLCNTTDNNYINTYNTNRKK